MSRLQYLMKTKETEPTRSYIIRLILVPKQLLAKI